MDSVCVKKLSTHFFVLIIFAGFSFAASAAVYKWTDAAGKVHYSDKKIDESAHEQNVAVGAMPNAPIVPVGLPTKYKGYKPSKWLAVTKPQLTLLESDAKRGKQFSFYFGGDCVSPTSLSLDDFKKRNVKYLADSTDFQEDIIRLLDTYNYRNLHFKPDGAMLDLENNEGYIFQIEFVDIKVNACLRKLHSPQDSGLLDEFSVSDFSKSNAWVKLRWSLKNATGEKILVSSVSEGAANDIEGLDAPISGMFRSAYRNAINNILVDLEFVKFMEPATPSIAGAAAGFDVRPQPKIQPERPSLSSLPVQMQSSFVTRAKFAQALMLVNPVRMSVTDYYASHDEWPAYFSDLDVDSTSLHEKGVVDGVDLRLGGALHVDLSPETFGPNQYFQLTPDASNRSIIKWDCKTTLEKSLWTGSCTGF